MASIFPLTEEQKLFLAKGTHIQISISQHGMDCRRAARSDRGKWPLDSILNWDGSLLPMSANLYMGRVYVREITR